MARVSTYLNFARTTEQAFEFYRSVFGGEFLGGFRRFADAPPASGQVLPPEDAQLVMHVALPILGGHVPMGTDSPGFSARQGSNVYICLDPDSRSDTERLFNALAEGGSVEAPLADMPWGAYFATLVDRFGVLWMFNCMKAE